LVLDSKQDVVIKLHRNYGKIAIGLAKVVSLCQVWDSTSTDYLFKQVF